MVEMRSLGGNGTQGVLPTKVRQPVGGAPGAAVQQPEGQWRRIGPTTVYQTLGRGLSLDPEANPFTPALGGSGSCDDEGQLACCLGYLPCRDPVWGGEPTAHHQHLLHSLGEWVGNPHRGSPVRDVPRLRGMGPVASISAGTQATSTAEGDFRWEPRKADIFLNQVWTPPLDWHGDDLP